MNDFQRKSILFHSPAGGTVSWDDGSITYSILPEDGKRNGHNVKTFTLRSEGLRFSPSKTL
jgi:hypothetical protein